MTTWTQPMCNACWTATHADRTPHRLTLAVPERCAWCGRDTRSGIYVREDPATLPYPTEELA